MSNKTESQIFKFLVDIIRRLIILNLARSNVATVNTYIYMKENFLENWRGRSLYIGDQTQWHLADGSSLTNGEKEILNKSGVVFHPKGKHLTKLFVMDESSKKWSIIVANLNLDSLKEELQNVGFQLNA